MSESGSKPQPGKKYRVLSSAGQGMSLAIEFAVAVIGFWLLGRFIDGRLGSDPWAQVTGAIVGWVGGFLHIYYATRPRPAAGPEATGKVEERP